jgi:hypothetical protein
MIQVSLIQKKGAVAKRINLLQLPFLCEGRKNSEKDMLLLKTENAKEDPPEICRVENAPGFE